MPYKDPAKNAEYNRKYRQNNREKISKYKRDYRRANSLLSLISSAKDRAKVRGLEVTITVDDVCVPSHCPVLGIPLFRSKGQPGPNSPTIDRIDNTRGYVPGNIMVISLRANIIKRDATIDELKAIVRYMENNS